MNRRSDTVRRSPAGLAMALISIGAILVSALPAAGLEHALRFRLGWQQLDGDSRYWNDKAIDFTGTMSDFDDVVVGFDYVLEPNRRVGVMFSMDYYEGSNDQAYLDYIDPAGNDIVHTTTLEIIPFTAAVVFQLAPPRAPVRPYLGAGGGLYYYSLRESGEFIDFTPVFPEIFRGSFETEGETLGFFVVGGLDIPLGHNMSFFAEGRWDDADDDLSDDFEGFGTLDLSGIRVFGGFTWKM